MRIAQLIQILSKLPPDGELVLPELRLPANEDYRYLVKVVPAVVEKDGGRIMRVHKADQFTNDVFVLRPAN